MDNKNSLQERFEIAERMRRANVGARVYNGSHRIQHHQYAGQRYTFFPDGVFVDPATGTPRTSDGITIIPDLYRKNPEELSKWRTSKNKGEATDQDLKRVRKDLVATAGDIIAHIVSKNRENGLTELAVGDVFDAQGNFVRTQADEDARLKTNARELAIETRRKASEEVMKHHRARTSGMGQNDPERLFTSEEKEASDYLAAYASGKLHKNRHVCRFSCGYWSHNEADLTPHYNVHHKDVVAEEERVNPPRRGPGRPKKVQQANA